MSLTDSGSDWARREDVRAMSQDILQQIDRRFQEHRVRGDERYSEQRNLSDGRHKENVERMDTIVGEVRETNGKVLVLEERQRSIMEEFAAVRKRWHEFRESIQLLTRGPQGLPGPQGVPGLTGENRQLTMRDVYVFAGGFGIFYAVAKLFHWLP